MISFRVIASLFIALLLLVGEAPFAQDQKASVFKVPISNFNPVIFNQCTNEDMQTYGELKFLTRSHFDANGTEHFLFKVQAHTAGATGLSTGQSYKAHGSEPNQVGNITADETGTLVFAARFGWVSNGPDANFFSTFVVKLTVNANGDLVVDRFTTLIECR